MVLNGTETVLCSIVVTMVVDDRNLRTYVERIRILFLL